MYQVICMVALAQDYHGVHVIVPLKALTCGFPSPHSASNKNNLKQIKYNQIKRVHVVYLVTVGYTC